MGSDETIGLQAAADELGVHYQTAYQWVRRGDLPAHQVGRQYVIARADLLDFRRAREAPAQPASRIPREGFTSALPRFYTALVDGDEATVRRITADYTETGTGISAVIDGLFAPALRRIGEEWHTGEVTIAEEHRATAIAERVLAINLPRKRGRPRGRAAVTTPTGDQHGLSAIMATAALKEAGWKVHHLGPDMPTPELVEFVEQNDIGVVVLSAGSEDGRRTAQTMIAELADHGIVAITNEAGMRLPDLVRAAEAVRR
ncbi:MAG: B12-binding domain-containing protein [Actinomycetota bacterium]